MRSERYLSLLKPFETRATKKVLQVNPTIPPVRIEPEKTIIFVFEYDADNATYRQLENVEDCYKYINSSKNIWINFDGLKKDDVNKICTHFDIHSLIAEDILSSGQRPKMDELNQLLYW